MTKNMVIVDIYSQAGQPFEKPAKVICTLAWDKKKKKVVILKGRRFARHVLKGRYLHHPSAYKGEFKYYSIEDGSKFIKHLHECLDTGYVFAVRRR
jgi:hypothetical protein